MYVENKFSSEKHVKMLSFSLSLSLQWNRRAFHFRRTSMHYSARDIFQMIEFNLFSDLNWCWQSTPLPSASISRSFSNSLIFFFFEFTSLLQEFYSRGKGRGEGTITGIAISDFFLLLVDTCYVCKVTMWRKKKE